MAGRFGFSERLLRYSHQGISQGTLNSIFQRLKTPTKQISDIVRKTSKSLRNQLATQQHTPSDEAPDQALLRRYGELMTSAEVATELKYSSPVALNLSRRKGVLPLRSNPRAQERDLQDARRRFCTDYLDQAVRTGEPNVEKETPTSFRKPASRNSVLFDNTFSIAPRATPCQEFPLRFTQQ